MQQLCLTSESQPKRRLSPRRFPSPTGKLAYEAIKYFCDRYRAQFNCPYVMDAKGRSIAAGNLLRLVQTLGLEEVKIRIDAYFREEWPARYGGYHLVGFVKHHQRVASSEAAQQIRAARVDASVKYPEAQKVIDFFCRRYEERIGSGYYLDPSKRSLALQCLAPVVESLGLNQVKQRMAAYIDDEWVREHSGHTLSGFIRDNQKYAGKAQEYAPPANLEFYAKMGPTVLPFGVARYGDGRPKFVGVCE